MKEKKAALAGWGAVRKGSRWTHRGRMKAVGRRNLDRAGVFLSCVSFFLLTNDISPTQASVREEKESLGVGCFQVQLDAGAHPVIRSLPHLLSSLS